MCVAFFCPDFFQKEEDEEEKHGNTWNVVLAESNKIWEEHSAHPFSSLKISLGNNSPLSLSLQYVQ